ncbi:MAG: NADH-quinone oxidoreductase subunit J [Chloroflexota bacterium]|nr:NADH-quinone oxidoreductase subunit J [Chloroflexota bacterium]
MDLASVVFWISAALLVSAALVVVGQRNIVHSALALVVVFAMASAIYVLLNAEFIAIVQILIYAGAVTILILFALMLTRIGNRFVTNPNNRWWALLAAAVISGLVGIGIIYAVFTSAFATTAHTAIKGYAGTAPATCALPPNNVVAIGQLLYSPTCYSYVLPFEIASVVLLVAIVGAIVIGREEE